MTFWFSNNVKFVDVFFFSLLAILYEQRRSVLILAVSGSASLLILTRQYVDDPEKIRSSSASWESMSGSSMYG